MIRSSVKNLFSHRLFPIIAVLFFAVVPYSNIFPNQFLGDDPDFIVDWQDIKRPVNYRNLLMGAIPKDHQGTYRPLRSMYYVIYQDLFGAEVTYYHINSILIHVACSLLIYGISINLTKNKKLSLVSSLVFASHPIHTEAITFITTSIDEIGTMWGLLSIWLYTQTNRKPWQYVLSVFIYIMAIFSYEIAIIIPLLLCAYHYFFDKDQKLMLKKVTPLIPFVFFAILYFGIRFNLAQVPTRGNYIGNSLRMSMILTLKEIPLYVFDTFLPIHISLDHRIPPSTYTYTFANYLKGTLPPFRPLETYTFFSIVFLISFSAAIIKLRHTHPPISFGLLWVGISLLPVLNIFPGYLIFFEKYLYLASFGSSLITGYLCYMLWDRRIKKVSIGKIVTVSLIVWFSTATLLRNLDWRNEIVLWEKTSEQSPNNAMVWFKLGSAYDEQDDATKAKFAYEKGKRINPDLYFIRTNLGIILYETGDIQQAMIELRAALDLYNNAKEANLYMGKIFVNYNDFDQALPYIQKALEIDKTYEKARVELADLHNRKGVFLAQNGLDNEALNAFKTALQVIPDYGPALTNMQALPQ